MLITESSKFVFIAMSSKPGDTDRNRFIIDVLNCIVVLLKKKEVRG